MRTYLCDWGGGGMFQFDVPVVATGGSVVLQARINEVAML